MPTDAEVAVLGDDVGLFDAIRSCRGIRRTKLDPAPDALIRKVCEAGTFAPSGGNRQPWFSLLSPILSGVSSSERSIDPRSCTISND